MSLVIWILLLVSGVLYSIAFINALIPFLSKRAYEESIFYRISFVGLTLHTLALALATYEAGSVPMSSVYELFILIAWLVMFIALIFSRIFRLKIAMFFGAMISAILVLLPLTCPYFNINIQAQVKSPLTTSHIFFAGLSYAFMGLGLVFAIIQNLQISALRKKKNSFFFRLLPSLTSITKYLFAVEFLAVFTMFLSIVLGVASFFVYDLNLSDLALKFACAFAIFFMQLGFVILSNKNLLRGNLQGYYAIILFIVSMLLLFPIDYT
ncbi:MAG: hypothetical protein R3Y46_03125 [Opitutales bacterium]